MKFWIYIKLLISNFKFAIIITNFLFLRKNIEEKIMPYLENE